MEPVDPGSSGGHSGDAERAKTARHYIGAEQSANGGPPRRQRTGWRVTPARIGLGLLAAVSSVVLLGVIRGDAGPTSGSVSAAELATEGPEAESAEQPGGDEIRRIVVSGGEPVDGWKLLSYRKGEVIRLWVDSDSSDVLKLDGYDVSQSVEAGGRATFEVRADVEGLHELVAESSGSTVAVVRVGR